MNSANMGIILLAAGASTRMGRPKQLLAWQDDTLLNHSISQAIDSQASELLVVLGANYESIVPTLPVSINHIYNKNWEIGMGTSIARGIREFQQKGATAALIMLADQPYLTCHYLNQLIASYTPEKQQIIATQYGKGIGVPAIFDSFYFDKLSQLKGDKGAKQLIQQYREHVVIHQPEKANVVDIDTEEIYWELKWKS